MSWQSYECFSILCDAFLLKSVISSHCNSCGGHGGEDIKFAVSMWKFQELIHKRSQIFRHDCINHSNLEMEPKHLTKSDV